MAPADILAKLSTCDYIVGADEVGRGCWAGPIVACAVIVSRDWPLATEVCDSKRFTGPYAESRREEIARKILPTVVYSFATMTNQEIDAEGVHKANIKVLGQALTTVLAKHHSLGCVGTYGVIVDGTMVVTYEHEGKTLTALSLPKADSQIPAVSAASILGKVGRDREMTKLAKTYPGYDFEKSKGYGTPAHQQGIQKLGVCEIHRRSFTPIRDYIQKNETATFQFPQENDE